MKTRLVTLVIILLSGIAEGSLFAQCCDPDSQFSLTSLECQSNGDPYSNWNGPGVCDTDCEDYNPCELTADCYDANNPACTIPLDGGLSLLALAGGGLATAAMRRRREEEEAAQEAA